MRLKSLCRLVIVLALLLGIERSASAQNLPNTTRLLRFPTTNGTQIVFCYAGQLYTVAKEGGIARRLTSGPGYTLPPEIRAKHVKGAVAAARLPDKINPSRVSNGSQFYICLAPMPNLNGQYTVFGNLIYGYETLDTISTLPVDSNDFPVERVEIKSLRIIPREQLPPPPEQVKPGAPTKARRWWQVFG